MKSCIIATLILCSITIVTQKNTKVYPFQDALLTKNARVDDLLKRLTSEEKIGLMMNKSVGIKRLNIPDYDWWNEALHGVARNGTATVFPQAIGMAATFNDAEHLNTFSMISDEGRAKYHKALSDGKRIICRGITFWTPNINIFRDPRWGRGQETYGEDPYLTSRFGVNAVKGLQGEDKDFFKAHACAKHFAVHSGPEWNRHSFNATASEKDLWQTYLPAFEALVKEAHVQEVMCAYNRFDNSPCCGSGKLLIDILRNKWNFDGLVVSDCGAIDDFYKPGRHESFPDSASASVAAVLSGTDIECGSSYESLIKALKLGLIKEQDLDVAVRRVLKARFDLGMFDDDSQVKWSQIPYSVVDCKAHKDQALKVARESMTLLKNNNNLLPLSKKLKKIAVIGANANDSVMLWANYNGYPSATTTILEGIKRKMPQSEIIYDFGCDLAEKTFHKNLMNSFSYAGKTGMYAEYFNNINWKGKPVTTTTGVTKFEFTNEVETQFAPKVNIYNFTARYKGVFTAPNSGKIIFSIKADDAYYLKINGKIVLEAPIYEKAANKSFYKLEIKKGQKVNVELDYKQLTLGANLDFLVYQEMPMEFASLKNKIKDADVVIYVGGLSSKLEGEEMQVSVAGFKGGDRTSIELPEIQRELLKELRSTGKPVVFVLCAGSAIGLAADEPNYDALLNAWYGGQAGGQAVADVLFGDYNPAGRLPVTFYKSTSQLPDFEDYSMANRTYRFMKDQALYPFGFGLSYTKFRYSTPVLSKNVLSKSDSTVLSVDVKNIGDRDGDEVVQVYVRCKNGSDQPLKSLKAFKRLNIKAGKTETIQFVLNPKTFESYRSETGKVEVANSEYEIMVGSSSLDDSLCKTRLSIQ